MRTERLRWIQRLGRMAVERDGGGSHIERGIQLAADKREPLGERTKNVHEELDGREAKPESEVRARVSARGSVCG